jgi:arabinose-5-phosphate isomerase
MTLKKFDKKSFANFHPAGSLGKKLTTTVEDLINLENKPHVTIQSKFSDAINEISSKMLGATAVLDNDKIVGIITDGDVRRILEKFSNPLNVILKNVIVKAPKTVNYDLLAIDALQIMNDNKITNLIVTKKNKYIGMLHIHDIINAGL